MRSNSTSASFNWLSALAIAASTSMALASCSATVASARASSASRVTVSILATIWPARTMSPSRTRIVSTRPGSFVVTSTWTDSIRPFPEAIPGGSAAIRACQACQARTPPPAKNASKRTQNVLPFIAVAPNDPWTRLP